MKRNIALLCIFMLLLGVAAGCDGGSSTQKPGDTTKPQGTTAGPGQTEKVYFWAWTNPDNMVNLTNEFNKEHAGKYELVYQKLADAATLTINTALASGEQIEVMTQASAFDLRQRADDGIYLGLKQFFDSQGTTYAAELGAATEETMNIEGDYYGVPYCKNIQVVYYNKKMFDEINVPYPKDGWTWDDLRETAKKFTKGEGANKVYGVMADLLEYWPMLAYQKLGAFYYYSDDKQSTRFDNPVMKESMQFWYDLVMTDKTAVPYEEYMTLKYNNDTNGIIGLYSNKYAMFLVPVYGCLYLNKSYGDIPAGTDIGMAYMPIPTGTTESVTSFYTSTCSIPSNVKNKDAAWTLLKYICFDRADLFAGDKAMHPGYDFKSEAEANTFMERVFNKPGLDQVQALNQMNKPLALKSQDITYLYGQAKINELIKTNVTLVFNGELSVDECLQTLKTAGDKAIADDMK